MQGILTRYALRMTAVRVGLRVVLMYFYDKNNDLINASFVQREVSFSSENDGGIVIYSDIFGRRTIPQSAPPDPFAQRGL